MVKKVRKRSFGHLINSLSTIVMMAMVVIAFLVVGVRIFGVTPYAVISGSMEPTYPVGSMVYVKAVQKTDLQVNDPVTFVTKQSKSVVTHRIVEIKENDVFVTKGDANNTLDSDLPFENIIGKPIFSLPYLGFISVYLNSTPGKILLIVLVSILLVSMLFSNQRPKKSSLEHF